MIVELRTYTVQSGAVAECLRVYEAEGLAIQKQILGNLIGYFYSEIGPLNQLIHMWGFKDLNDRQQRRESLNSTPSWQEYQRKIRSLIVSQETQIMNCASFSPIS